MATPDRLEKLLAQTVVTGIDFIYIHPNQVTLDIYFYLDPTTLNNPLPTNLGEIKIYSPSGAAAPIPATVVGIMNLGAGNFLRITAARPGNYVLYNLFINDNRIDPYYNDVAFSFKANCPSDLDCKPGPHECSPDELVDFPIDYTARDFWSYRTALLEFASLRYPNWPDRLAADAGVMIAEVMSAVGDDMAYYQDRIGREAFLETATQRRSIRRHSRLVDYEMKDNMGSLVWIDVTVKAAMSGNIPAGADIWSLGENSKRTDFEIGLNLEEWISNKQYFVDSATNEFTAYQWDEDQTCLLINSTEVFISGHHAAKLLNFAGFTPSYNNGKWVLLETRPTNPAQPIRKWMVRLISVTNTTDPVFGNIITRIKWDGAQALPFEMDLTTLFVRGNLIPATSGKTLSYYFITGADLEELPLSQKAQLKADANFEGVEILRAIEREGNEDSITYLSSLRDSEQTNLVWLPADDFRSFPEIHLDELDYVHPNWTIKQTWNWRRSFVGVNSSGDMDTDFTLDDGTWRRVVGYWRNGQKIVHEDYASGSGTTIRFGNDQFGLMPAEQTVFKVKYRLGGGQFSNVGSNAIKNFDSAALNFVQAVSNPLNAVHGVDPEEFNHARQSAPQEFRTITYRAVRPEDYAEAAERLPWVQKAGAAFRWTGSWLTAFVTPDPKNAVTVSVSQQNELQAQLNRFRQAGREAYTMEPIYADLDLEIEVCALPTVFGGELKERIMLVLFGKKGIVPVKGFFSPDRYSFGDPLQRSQLEATIQDVEGVNAVEEIKFRRRGVFNWKVFDQYEYNPGMNVIIRVENDLLHPERGTLKIHIHGGA